MEQGGFCGWWRSNSHSRLLKDGNIWSFLRFGLSSDKTTATHNEFSVLYAKENHPWFRRVPPKQGNILPDGFCTRVSFVEHEKRPQRNKAWLARRSGISSEG